MICGVAGKASNEESSSTLTLEGGTTAGGGEGTTRGPREGGGGGGEGNVQGRLEMASAKHICTEAVVSSRVPS